MSNNESYGSCGAKDDTNTTIFFDIDPYAGIPSNLIINVGAFIIFVLLFLIFHKKAYQSINEFIGSDSLEKHANSLGKKSYDEVQTLSLSRKQDDGNLFLIPLFIWNDLYET